MENPFYPEDPVGFPRFMTSAICSSRLANLFE